MKTKELPIYTHQIYKGNALKIKACRLFSFSEKEKEMIKDVCYKLGLSDLIYDETKRRYYEYLKTIYKTTGLHGNAIYPIVACAYLSAIENKEPRTKRDLHYIFGFAPVTIVKWVEKIVHSENPIE